MGEAACLPAEIARHIRRRIRTGEFSTNIPLPAASHLADAYGASREEMVEALALLVADQVLLPSVETRLVVNTEAEGAGTDPTLSELYTERARLMRDLAALRAALDDDAIAWAARNSGASVLEPDQADPPAGDASAAAFRVLNAVASVVFCASESEHGPIEQTRFTKSWTGGLVGISEGVVLSGNDQHSVGMVSFEVFTGQLDGLEGSIAFQQYEVERERHRLMVYESVPESGTEGLADVAVVIDLQLAGDQQHVTVVYRCSTDTSSGGSA